MENIKILALEDSLTIAWPENNFLNSILRTVNTGYDWLMNTHIQTYGSEYHQLSFDIHESRITFYPFGNMRANVYDLCPFIRKYIIPRQYVTAHTPKFTDFLIKSISDGYYVCTVINEFFLEGEAFDHPCYFFGYDATKQIIYSADNFDYGKYEVKELTFEQVNKAFLLCTDDIWENSITLYDLIDYTFEDNIEFMTDQIKDYLDSGSGMCYLNRFYCPSSTYGNEQEHGKIFMGLNCYTLLYDIFDNWFETNVDNVTGDEEIDLRSFAFLCDHKNMMKLRNQYLKEKKLILPNVTADEKFDKLCNACEKLLHLLIKFNITFNKKLLYRAKETLDEIRQLDEECMYYTLESLNKVNSK